MIIEISKSELAFFFEKAKDAYFVCVSPPDNAYLNDEVSGQLDLIEFIQSEVKVKFFLDEPSKFVFEVTLLLYITPGEIIGKYIYWENEMHESVDDMLVFF
jgi:hypothetical protein